ncbi:MAG: serine hydrolase [Reyranellaceae bacterium]
MTDWAMAAPEEVGLDGRRLDGLATFLKQWPRRNVHAVLVARRGRLAFECYFAGRERRWMDWTASVRFAPDVKHDIRSISKSVTSLLVGLAIGEGRFPSLDTPVIDSLPDHAGLRTARNAGITLRHLLTMAHGQRWDEGRAWTSRWNNERQLLQAHDPVRYVLEQPMTSPPGGVFCYSGGATTLLAAVLARAVDRSLDAYAREVLFGPLGITDVDWLRFPNTPEVAAFAGLRLRPRDLARIGQLVADDGRWGGRQLVPAGWIAESTAPRLNVEGRPGLFYGYHWWLGRSLVQGREVGWTAGFGSGGQRLFVVPSLDLVVVVTAFDPRPAIPLALLDRFVLPAVMDLPPAGAAPFDPPPPPR